MYLVRLLYVSRLGRGTGPTQVQNIVKVSEKNNPGLGITGALCYDARYFLQYLEGPRDAINQLYRKIAADARHDSVTLLDYTDISQRQFEDWSMAYIRASDLNKSVIRKFGRSDTFDPYNMTAEQALGFITTIFAEREQFLEQAANEVKKKKSKKSN